MLRVVCAKEGGAGVASVALCQDCQQPRTPPLQIGQLAFGQLQARAMRVCGFRAHLCAFDQAHAIRKPEDVVQAEAGGDQPLNLPHLRDARSGKHPVSHWHCAKRCRCGVCRWRDRAGRASGDLSRSVSDDLRTHLQAVQDFLRLCFATQPPASVFDALLAGAALASWDMRHAVQGMSIYVAGL
ncbi:hypothetical protein XGA_4414 [Xanthomonas hortorum ATCC 19865]|nr:hypothetical protein XGA_4414 [Xanthomonas hortorum ATCC 19865]